MAYVPRKTGTKKRPGVNQAKNFIVLAFLLAVQPGLFVAVLCMG